MKSFQISLDFGFLNHLSDLSSLWPVIQEIFDLENLILHGAAADGPLSQLLTEINWFHPI